MPWLIQGTTGRGDGGGPFDLALFAPERDGRAVWERWWRLAEAAGAERIAHGRQVHGARVRLHRKADTGMTLVPACDGHAAAEPGILLAVTVADCVPVFLVEPRERVVALLHAGWRGVAAGILGRGVELLRDRLGIEPGQLLLHAGPAVCGDCYEVGPEVHRALGLADPGGPAPVDLRAILARRAVEMGVPADAVSLSSHCTLCGDSPFFSHRGGDGERQAAVLGVRRPGEAAW